MARLRATQKQLAQLALEKSFDPIVSSHDTNKL